MTEPKRKGQRIYPDSEGRMLYPEGGYGKDPRDGVWYARPPKHKKPPPEAAERNRQGEQ